MYLSEEYYKNLFEDFINDISIDNDELLESILKEIIFEEIYIVNESYSLSKRLYIYKEGALSNIWKYGQKDVKDVGKDIKNIFSKIKGGANKKIERFVLKKILQNRKVKMLGASILAAIILSISFKAYKLRRDDICSKFKGEERSKCNMSLLDNMIKSIKDQMKVCDQSKDPVGCRNKLMKAIERLEKRKNKFKVG